MCRVFSNFNCLLMVIVFICFCVHMLCIIIFSALQSDCLMWCVVCCTSEFGGFFCLFLFFLFFFHVETAPAATKSQKTCFALYFMYCFWFLLTCTKHIWSRFIQPCSLYVYDEVRLLYFESYHIKLKASDLLNRELILVHLLSLK